jgi:type II secretion system protein N
MKKLSFSPETRKKVLRWLGYSALSFFAFLLFLYWTFPWERLVRYAVAQAKTQANVDVEVEGFAPSFGTGVTVDHVSIKTAPVAGEKEGATYEFDHVAARISLVGLLFGDREVSFSAEALGGEVEGTYLDGSGGERGINAELRGIDLGKIQLLSNYAGLPIEGDLSGAAQLTIPARGVRSATGHIELQIENGKVGAEGAKLDPSKYGTAKITGYDQSITLKEGAKLGTFSCKIEVQNGKGAVEEFGSSGGEVEAHFAGTLLIKDRLLTSVLSGVLKFRFDESYVERNGMDLFLTSPRLAQAKTDDGFFAYNINDPLNRLSFKPSRRDGNKGTRPSPGVGVPSNFDSDAPQVARPALAPALNMPAGPADLGPGTKEEERPSEEKEPSKEEEKKEGDEKKPEDGSEKESGKEEKPAVPSE